MMFAVTLSPEEQRHLAKNVVCLLSHYKHISDSFIIEFFSENLWGSLPVSWQNSLVKLSPPEIADLLLDKSSTNRRYPSVWPLSLLALRASAHALAYPRVPPGQARLQEEIGAPEEFQNNHSQSSLLRHIFRKHVKPKKQHEIRRLGMMVENLCQQTNCHDVIDVGSGQGHLTRFLSFGLGLSVTAIEADAHLVLMARKFDDQLCWTLAKERLREIDTGQPPQEVCGPSPCHIVGWVNPKAPWEDFMEQLSRRDTEAESERPVPTGGPCKKRQWVSMSARDRRPEAETLCLCSAKCDSVPGRTERDRAMSPPPELKDCHGPLVEDPRSPNCLPEMAMDTPAAEVAASDVKTLTASMKLACCCSHSKACSKQLDIDQVSAMTPSCTAICPGDVGGFVLTGLHACGDLSATLLRHFASCPHIQGITSVACCYMKITTKENPSPPGVITSPASTPISTERDMTSDTTDFGYPMSQWVRGLPGHELSYKAREGACHAIEDYLQRLREDSALLRTHCYRAILETIIRGAQPDLRRAGIQTIKKAHTLPFAQYARLGLPRVGLSADLPLDEARVEAMLAQQGQVVAYFSLSLLLAPVVETLVLLDRMLFLQEQGIQSQLVALFDPAFSPRNLVLVATKQGLLESGGHLKMPFK